MAHAPLHPDARSFLAREVGRAREIAEKGARASLTALAVADKVVPAHFTEVQRKLRNRLRAHARQLGDERTADGQQEVSLLTEEVAYQHWHRMLFARFLAENGLLREDEGDQPIDLDECRALAADRSLDIWVYAALCAQKMLPGVFRLDDPALELKLDGAAQVELNGLMAGLQAEIFKATDALGWVYQYWQAKRKDEVNASGVKIGAKELSPVTQLFTEDYMVDFLLHNTLGAWWAGKQGPIEASNEEEARTKAGLPAKDGLPAIVWTYLRFIQDAETKKWTPAAGTFEGWPKKAKDITFLDPCMGSGHFPVFALPILARMRMEEERGTAAENIHAALKDQIHGLELDQRCCQIGAFNLALKAWKLAGFQQLPPLNVACCGIAPRAKLTDWVKLAGDDEKLKAGMIKLHRLFDQAPELGSLLRPNLVNEDLFSAKFDQLKPLLDSALTHEGDESIYEFAVVAKGMAISADILSTDYTLIMTNVPFLGLRDMGKTLYTYVTDNYPDFKGDLGYCMWRKMQDHVGNGCTLALVTMQHWLSQSSYKKMRKHLLQHSNFNILCPLGVGAFQEISGEKVNITLTISSARIDASQSSMCVLNASAKDSISGKISQMRDSHVLFITQEKQLSNPDHIITFKEQQEFPILSTYADCLAGIMNGDTPKFVRKFWEVIYVNDLWAYMQTATGSCGDIGGLEEIIFFDESEGHLREEPEIRRSKLHNADERGNGVWGRSGVAITQMSSLKAARYYGNKYDSNVAAIVPRDPQLIGAIWEFCSCPEFSEAVRSIDRKLNVTNATLGKIPFDLNRWVKVASEKHPEGLPKAYSSDPTQWLFSGHPHKSDNPLQVAVARLLCYQWPRQTGSSFPDCPALGPDGLEGHADDDGIVALSPINREEAAAARVRALLKSAYGNEWQDGVTERQLLADAGHGGVTLEDWLRDSFFEEHCKLFHHRPFVWHIWDGERDGFHALVNYHRLAGPNGEGARLLQKLAQTYLGDWIARCEADVKNDKPNAHKLLKAAKDLQADLLKILEGEAPHDIFVRWKPLHEQSIGWNPDINDGVRLNIRPFLTVRDVGKKGAGLLRWKPNIKWDKDRGSEPERPKAQLPWFWSCLPEDKPEHVTDFTGGTEFTGERWNNLHYSLATKKAARAKFSPKK